MTELLFGIVTGALGVGYIAYGRRQTKFMPMISGVMLCVYTYFVSGWLWLSIAGALLLAAPFVVDF